MLPRARYFLNGFISSVFILAVPQARRAQLGSYVTRQSLDAGYGVAKRRGWWKPIPQGDTMLLALGLATLTALYETRPKAVESSIRKSVWLLLGNSATVDKEKQVQLKFTPQAEEKKTQ